MTDFIIDSHCHIFPKKLAKKAVDNIGGFYKLPMYCDGTANGLLKNKADGVNKFIVCSVALTANQVASINDFLFRVVSDNPSFYGLISLHPDMSNKDIEKSIKFAKDHNFKGIKLHPDFQKFNIDQTCAEKIYQRAEGVLPILFHTGDENYNYSNPTKLAKILKKYKNLTAIAAHFGGYSNWDKLGCYLDLPNIYFDTSSSLFKLEPNAACKIIETFGDDKFLFGTDYPMWQAKAELERLYKLNLPSHSLKKILRTNAQKVYNLDT